MGAHTNLITKELVISVWRKSLLGCLTHRSSPRKTMLQAIHHPSVNLPLPVLFPENPHLDNDPGSSSGRPNEDSRRIEDPEGEGDTVMAGVLPDPEISSFLAQPSQPSTLPILSNETGRVFHQEGRNNPPNQSSTERSCRQQSFPLTPPIDPPHRET